MAGRSLVSVRPTDGDCLADDSYWLECFLVNRIESALGGQRAPTMMSLSVTFSARNKDHNNQTFPGGSTDCERLGVLKLDDNEHFGRARRHRHRRRRPHCNSTFRAHLKVRFSVHSDHFFVSDTIFFDDFDWSTSTNR